MNGKMLKIISGAKRRTFEFTAMHFEITKTE